MSSKTPNSPMADPGDSKGEERRHQGGEMHEMIEEEIKRLSKFKKDMARELLEITYKQNGVVIEETEIGRLDCKG